MEEEQSVTENTGLEKKLSCFVILYCNISPQIALYSQVTKTI